MDSVEPLDLVEYGLIPEFLGRFPNIISTESLDLDHLVQVLTKPKNAIIKQYKYLFAMSGVQFHVTDGALRAIARKAMAKKTGARGLRSILEKVLMETMFVVPLYEEGGRGVEEEGIPNNISGVYVDAEAVEQANAATPLLIMHPYALSTFIDSLQGSEADRSQLPDSVESVNIADYCYEHGSTHAAQR